MSSRIIKKKNLNEIIITEKGRDTVQQKSSGKISLQIHSLLFSILTYPRRLTSELFNSKSCFLASSWALPLESTSRRMKKEKRGQVILSLGTPCGVILGWLGPLTKEGEAFKWLCIWVPVATPSHCPFKPTVTPKGVLHSPL